MVYLWLSLIVILLIILCYQAKNTLKDSDFKPKVYASLTTIPERAENTERVIQGLLNQTYPIEKIFLNIPNGIFKRTGNLYYVPEWTKKKEYEDKLVVTRGLDYGPATKLLGSLTLIPQDGYVYVVDDDTVHSKNHLKDLISEMNPNTDVVSNRVCEINSYICGVTGYVIKRNILNDIFNYYYKVPISCRTVDDVWISEYLKSKDASLKKTNLMSNIKFIPRSLYDRFLSKDPNSLFNSVNRSNQSILNKFFGETKNSKCKKLLNNM